MVRSVRLEKSTHFFAAMMPLAIARGEPPGVALAVWEVPMALIGLTLDRGFSTGTTGS